MTIHVNTKYAGGEQRITSLLPFSSPALDALWKKSWVTDATFGPALPNLVKELNRAAGELRYKCDRIIVVASGAAAALVQSALDMVGAEGFLQVESFSSSQISRVVRELQTHSSGMIVVSLEEDTVAERAMYTIAKQALASKYGGEEFTKHIRIISNGVSEFYKEELEMAQLPVYPLAEDIDIFGAASTEALLFPLLASGAQGTEFIDGFREMAASTWWDQDADRFALYLAAHVLDKQEAGTAPKEDIVYWQPELEGLARWTAALHRKMGIQSRIFFCPREQEELREDAFCTSLYAEKEDVDIMLPGFPGADPEGSMNCQLKSAAEELAASKEGVAISLDELNLETYGQLMAYVQMSCGIVRFACEKASK